jgi:Na+/melibiose symporter-like transporter
VRDITRNLRSAAFTYKGLLSSLGSVANVAQNAHVLAGLKSMMSVIPVVGAVLMLAILMIFYKLDEPLMEKVKAELDERRKAQEQPA